MRIFLVDPLWLILLAMPITLLWRKTNASTELRHFSDKRLWPWIVYRAGTIATAGHRLVFVALILIIIALSGPLLQYQHPPTNIDHQDGKPSLSAAADIIFVLDISSSMDLDDALPSRLQRAIIEIEGILPSIKNSRIALVSYAGSAYTLLPLSLNHDMLLHYLPSLDTPLVHSQGSNIAAGLLQAQRLLKNSFSNNRIVLLFTDGGTQHRKDTIKQAKLLAKENISLYVIGIGSERGKVLYDKNNKAIQLQGRPVISKLEADFLSHLAAIGGGKLFHSSGQVINLSILTALNQEQRNIRHKGRDDHPLFLWPLGIGIILLLWVNHRRWYQGLMFMLPLAISVTFLLSFAPSTSHASLWPQQRAYDALIKGQYHTAIYYYKQGNSYHDKIGLGTAYYRHQEWQLALTAFQQALPLSNNTPERAKALFNSGNSLLQMKETERARVIYQLVLSLQPQHKQAAYNLNLLSTKNSYADEKRSRHKITKSAEASSNKQDSDTIDEALAGHDKKLPQKLSSNTANKNAASRNNKANGNTQQSLRQADEITSQLLQHRISKQDNRQGIQHPAQTW